MNRYYAPGILATLRISLWVVLFSLSGSATIVGADVVHVCGQADENTTLVLHAPPGHVLTSIAFASYGNPVGTCGGYQLGSCDAPLSLNVASERCLGFPGCEIAISNGTFGDPCVNTGKRMYVEALASSGIIGPHTICEHADEGSAVTLTALPGEVITRIDFVSYGLPTGVCGALVEDACASPTSRAVVEAACLGRNQCTILASNELFGDPCVGSGKRLYVQAQSDSLWPVGVRASSWGALKIRYR